MNIEENSQEPGNNATGAATNTGHDNEPRERAGDKSAQDADENLPEEHKKDPVTTGNGGNVDELVRGEKLEEKYRGGDVTDADEFKEDR